MTIDREGGVNLDDCADFSRRVGAYLEAEDPITGAYSLEVSSPGLDRRLVKPADYERFKGQEIFGHVIMVESERSPLSSLAVDLL